MKTASNPGPKPRYTGGRLALRLDEDDYRWVQAQAILRGASVSDVVRELVREAREHPRRP